MLTLDAVVAKMNGDKLDYLWLPGMASNLMYAAYPDGIWLIDCRTDERIDRTGDCWMTAEPEH